MRPALLISTMLAAMTIAAPATAKPDAMSCAAATRYSDAHRGVAVHVLDHGKIVCDTAQGGHTAPHELWSGTKSFVGIMAAAAVQDGLLTLDEPASATLIEWQGDPQKSRITIRQILSMTSGQPSVIGKPPTYRDSLDGALVADPGTRFLYGPTPMQSFGEILKRKLKAAGQSDNVLAYLARRVLDPIGLRYADWRKGIDGNPLLPQGAILTAAEWAKFGEFIRAGGTVAGKPIVDPASFAAMFKSGAVNPAYGLTWWLPHVGKAADPITAGTDIGRRAAELPADIVLAAGAGDQRLYVIPSLGLTIVRMADLDIAALMNPPKDPAKRWSDVDFLKLLKATD
ncbi:serine hydrolase domain-containing protein [Sphingomonas alpina]|uniref:Beta-lactamase family protein n=1 Tax=Sphingomonas alpina TaxID=653931 RepID=A0A7H0LP13_9SPHN|nr:serine hydrolase domain-containing protein [Sphingomonas alpina]QNQ11416.1 beta-lactamase family protein [Sphingomonas alpina]